MQRFSEWWDLVTDSRKKHQRRVIGSAPTPWHLSQRLGRFANRPYPANRRRCAAATIPADRNLIQRQICATGQATARAIDALVYELYGSTEEEIGIVGGGATRVLG